MLSLIGSASSFNALSDCHRANYRLLCVILLRYIDTKSVVSLTASRVGSKGKLINRK